jgi:hypothetical protein
MIHHKHHNKQQTTNNKQQTSNNEYKGKGNQTLHRIKEF